MAKKLLHKTSRSFLVFAVLILIISAPVFYFVTEKLYIDDADEALLLRKHEFEKIYASSFRESDVPLWNKFNREINLINTQTVQQDTLFYSYHYDSLAQENEPYRELLAPVTIEGKLYTYNARVNLIETEDLIESIAIFFSAIISLLLLGLYIINKRLSQHLWKSFYETLKQIEAFEIDKSGGLDFSETNIEEFSRLNQSIKKLIEKNTLIYQSQKEFIENAAHELQTPLAIIQAKIDTLIQSGEFSNQQNEILSALNDSISRLNRLNKNLLLLSKIENDTYHEKQEVRIKEIITKYFDFFAEQAKSKNIQITTELNTEVSLTSNPVLAEILVSNLFMNAIRHNVPNGQILIQLSGQSLSFQNTGIASALDSQKLFTRFSKTNPNDLGNGLGLAIVKKIAELNGWKISYAYTSNRHSFTVLF